MDDDASKPDANPPDGAAPAPREGKAARGARPDGRARSRWSRWAHALARIAAWAAVAVVALVVGAAWLASREGTVRWAADQIERYSGGEIVLDDVKGSLIEGLAIGRVRYTSPELALTIEKLAFTWFWIPPTRVQVSTLEAERVLVESRSSSDEPATPPATLALPINLHIARFALGELVIARPGASAIRIAHVEGSARANRRRIAVELARAEAFGLLLHGEGRIAAEPPFATDVTLAATLPEVPMIAGLSAHATGPLERIEVQAEGRFADAAAAPVAATTVLQPFAAAPLGTIHARAERVPLTAFGVSYPQALLAASAELGIDEHGEFGGPVEVRNTTPGGLEEERVPLETARAQLRIDGGVRFESLAAAAREGGTLAGRVAIVDGTTLVDLAARNLSLRTVHAALAPVRVAGPVRLEFKGGAMQADARLAGAELELASHFALAHDELSFAPLTLKAGAGRIEGQGKLALGGKRALAFEARAAGFDPSRVLAALDPRSPFAQWRDARLNGRLAASGTLAPEIAVRMEFESARSQFAGIEFDGSLRGALATRAGHIALDDVEADMRMSENTLVARGGWGQTGSVLSYALHLPRLDRFSRLAGVPLAGRLDLNGTVVGTAGEPVAVLSAEAGELAVGAGKAGFKLASLAGEGVIEAGRVRADFLALDLDTGTARFPQATLQARGSVQEHEVVAQARGSAYGRPVQATLELAGGWRAEGGVSAWRGQLVRLQNDGGLAVRLLAPAPLELGLAQQRLGATALAIADGRLDIDGVEHRDGRLATRGHFEGVAVQALARWFPALQTPKSTLTLTGRWDAAIADAIDAHLHVERERGDLWVASFSSGALGIERFVLDANVEANAAHAQLDFKAARAGNLSASAATQFSRRDGIWGVAGSAPLDWKLKGELTSLAWLGLLFDTPLNAEGHLTVDAERSGTVAEPVLRGSVVGEKLALRTFDPRAQLTDGRLRVLLDNRRLTLDEFVFTGRGGQLAGSGVVDMTESGPDGIVDFAFEHLDALTDPLYHVVVSGAVRVALAQGKSTVTGQLNADEGRVTLRDTTAPTLGGDVVLTSGEQAGEESPARKPFPLTVALVFDLGRDFEVSGYGAETALVGTVEIEASAGQPLRAKGGIETRRGVYYAYGQKLTIEQGQLAFSGPIDNPGIHFRAERPDLPVTVGVEVTGSLTAPKATLYSTPDMSDTERLSWLALGHGLESATRSDVQVLSLAASALLSRGEGVPLQTQLAKTFGLDEVGVRSDSTLSGDNSLATTVVAVGKRISRRLYLTFERSLAGTSTVAKLRYEVGRRWYIQTLTGTENAIDVFFAFTFD